MRKCALLVVLFLSVGIAGCPCPDHDGHKQGKYPPESAVRVIGTGHKGQVMYFNCKSKRYLVAVKQPDGDVDKGYFYEMEIEGWDSDSVRLRRLEELLAKKVTPPSTSTTPSTPSTPSTPAQPAPVVQPAPTQRSLVLVKPPSWTTFRWQEYLRDQANK